MSLKHIVMAIYKENMLKDIYGIVRKGSVQFEPGDYVPININNKGKDITLLIGGVHYDDSLYDVCYDLYTQDFDPVRFQQPLKISNLTPNDLCSLGSNLYKYEDYALNRYVNFENIDSLLNDVPEKCIRFERESEMPLARINSSEELRIVSVFKDDKGECFAGLLSSRNQIENIRLVALTDKVIKNIDSCLKVRNKNIQMEQSSEKRFVNYFHK